ncbi:MAG: hypothetical protein FWD05_09855 [Oscillospiraceae bacterium]|nr:hypothetical protein [Oscillospiraceae bacterium]
MNLCKNCGQRIEENASFCQNCRHNAETSLLCGILSIVTSFTVLGGVALGILAVMQARISKKKNNPATGGMVTGILGIGLAALSLTAIMLFLPFSTGDTDLIYTPYRYYADDQDDIDYEDIYDDEYYYADYDYQEDIEDDYLDDIEEDVEELPVRETTDPPVVQESYNIFYTQLTPEQVETFDRGQFIILRKLEEGTNFDGLYTFHSSNIVELSDDGRLVADFDGRAPQVFGGDESGEYGPVTSVEIERTDTHIIYRVLIDLHFGGYGGWLEIEVDAQSDDVTILSMIPFDYIDYSPEDRPEVDIFDTWLIVFPSFSRLPTYDNDGNLMPFYDWERPGQLVGREIVADFEVVDNFSITMKDLDTDFNYYIFFNFRDIYGNTSSSQLLRIELP